MAKKTEEAGSDFVLEVIDTVDEEEQAAFDAIRNFVQSVDEALPGGGTKGDPSRRVEIVEAGLKMIEQMLGVSNDVARRLTESVSQALPEIERNVKTTTKKASAKKSTAKKKGAAKKKSTAKKSSPKKKSAAKKKSTAKKGAAKKSTAKKSAAKKSTAKKGAAKKSTAKKSAAKKSTAKKSAAKKS